MDRREMLGWLAVSGAHAIAAPILLGGCEPVRNPIAGAAQQPASPILTPPSFVEQLAFRRSAERGSADHGWLKARHTFSFARYQDPAHMSFRALRVMNEDVIGPGGGFPMHPHKDMEILTYVLDGALEHKDSMSNGSIISPGEVQTMSAGTGIRHSEFNPSQLGSVHLLQIWMTPDARHHTPRYQQKTIPRASAAAPIRLIASPNGAQGSVAIHQDARIHAVNLKRGEEVLYEVKPGRHAWVQVARGRMTLNTAHTLEQGDGVSTGQAGALLLGANIASECLIFDLA